MLLRGVHEFAHQIVIVRFADAETAHFARPGRAGTKVVDQAYAVDLRRLCRHTGFPQQIGFFRWAFDQNGEFVADQLAIAGSEMRRWMAISLRLRR